MIPNNRREPKTRRREIAVIVLAAITGLLAVVSYFLFDERIVSWLVHDGTEWHRAAPVRAFALLGKTWLQIWLLLVWFCAVGRARPVLAALGTIAVIAVVVPLLKFATHRTRPTETSQVVGLDDSGPNDKPTWYANGSFPSGDTATACGVAVSVGFLAAWPWMPALLAAGASVGLLRVVALAHYPSDALAGAAVGMLCAWLILRASRRWPLPDPVQPVVWRRAAAVGVVLIALPILLSHNTQRSMLFLTVYVLPITGLYVLQKIINRGAGRRRDRRGLLGGWGRGRRSG